MTQEERIAAVERIVNNQFYSIVVQAIERRGPVVATKDQLFDNYLMYVRYASTVIGDEVDCLVSDATYWDVVKRLADPKELVVSDDDVRIVDDFDYDKYWKH